MKKAKFNRMDFSMDIKVKLFNDRLSLRKAAKRIGISASTLQRIKSGRLPDIKTYPKVCNWLNEPVSWYFNNLIKHFNQ